MKIAIIGAGRVGSTLGKALAARGHEIIYAVRDAGDSRPELLDHGTISVVPAAVARADAAILTTPWAATEAAVRSAGDFQGKPLIDVTNPLGKDFGLTVGHTDSGAETVARWAANAKVVKAFNSTGMENMADPVYGEHRVVMPICGDDEGALDTAAHLATDLGFEVVKAGPLRTARLIEPFGRLWIELALVRGLGRNIAWGLLRR